MSDYRKEAGEIARETSWTFWRFLPIFSIAVVVLAGLGFGLRSLGLIGGTVLERKVFEQSYQRSEALLSEIATHEATLATISQQLLNPTLDPQTISNLKAQQAATRIRLDVARRKAQ